MSGSIIQRSFAAGEIAVDLYARADQTKYQTGLKTCRNMYVMRHGGVTNRTGSKMIQEIKDSSARAYFMKFVFNSDQTYLMEFGNLYIRFYRSAAQLAVSGVTAWSGVTNYVIGDLASRLGVNYYCTLAHSGIQPPNVAAWYPLTGSIFEVPTPYLTADLAALQFVQSGDVITITHPSYRPRELSRTGHTAWTLIPISTVPGISAPTGLAATAGTAGALDYDYVVTAVEADTFEESLPSSPDNALCTAPTSALPNTLAWTAVTGATEYNVYLDKDGNGIYGFIGTAKTNAYNDIGYTPDLSYTPPIDRPLFTTADNYPSTVAYYQQRQMFANTNNEPEKAWASRSAAFKNFTISSPIQDDDAITFNIAGRNVNEIRHMIEVGELILLTSGGEWTVEGDADGVLTPVAINPKQHGYGGAAEVKPAIIGNNLIYTQARGNIVRDLRVDVTADGYAGRDLTIFSAHLFDGYTVERMDYAQIPHSIVWVVRSDGTLLGLTYMPEQEVWGWHRHDTEGFYEDVCVLPEGDEDAVYVLVRRIINGQTRRYIERFASRRVTDIKLDALFLDSFLSYDGRVGAVVTVTLTSASGGWTHDHEITVTMSGAGSFVAGDVGNAIALLDANFNEIVRVVIGTYVGATVVRGYPDHDVPVANQGVAAAVWSRAVDQVSGLDHLEGMTVKVLADGNSLADAVVVAGVVTLDRPYSVIHVGLGYVSIFETLDLDIAGQQMRDSKKKVNGITLLVKETRGGFIGPDVDNLVEFKTDTPEDYTDPDALVTGRMDVNMTATWEELGRVFFLQREPLPVTILAAIPNGDIGG